MNRFALGLVLGMVLLLPACMHHRTELGTRIGADKAAQIIEGKTTEAEVIMLLGPPERTSDLGAMRSLSYSHVENHAYSHPFFHSLKGEHVHEMLILMVKDGVVTKKSYSVNRSPIGFKKESTLSVPERFQ